ncbi:MAG: hypothetical protein AAF098_04645 [Pseudomonadota bacterium]
MRQSPTVLIPFILKLAIIFTMPALVAAQELRTLTNGTVADAEDLNFNFSQLQKAVASVGNAGPFDPDRHVTLTHRSFQNTSCALDVGFARVNLDGTGNSQEFVVPDNYTLFITDISWQALDDPGSFSSGRTLAMVLRAQNPDGSNSQVVYYSPKVNLTSLSSSGRPGVSDSLTAGVAVGEGRQICPRVFSFSQSSLSSNSITDAVLLGFLVPND